MNSIVLDVRVGFHVSRVVIDGGLFAHVGHSPKTAVGSDGGFARPCERAQNCSARFSFRGLSGLGAAVQFGASGGRGAT